MIGRGVASLIGLVGGLLIVVGGLVALLGQLSGGGLPTTVGGLPYLLAPLLVFVAGFAVLVVARPRLFWWPGRRTFNAVVLIGLGLFSWILGSGSLLTLLGALLAVIAAVVLVVEGFDSRFFGLRRWFHRF